MKKLIIIASLFFATSIVADAQITHNFKLSGYTLGEPTLSQDSLSYNYNIQVVVFEQAIKQHFGTGKFEQVVYYPFTVAASKNAKQIGSILRDSVKAFINRTYPDF